MSFTVEMSQSYCCCLPVLFHFDETTCNLSIAQLLGHCCVYMVFSHVYGQETAKKEKTFIGTKVSAAGFEAVFN